MKLERAFVLLLTAIGAIIIPTVAHAQGDVRPSFEVASIKPDNSGSRRVSIGIQPGGRFVASGLSLTGLMTYAYRVRDFQILGGPDWIKSDRWDIQARAEEGSVPRQTGPRISNDPDPVALRVQSLLEDRFQLKFQRETRELPVYELSVAKGGLKIKPTEDQSPMKPPEPGESPPPPFKPGGPMPRGSMMMGPGRLDANGVEFSQIVQMLSQQLGRTVVDKTGLKGLYDIALQWVPEMNQGIGLSGPPSAGMAAPPAPDPAGPSIFTAIQEQLGLKVDSEKGPVEVLVIDSVQKPSEN